MSEFLEYDKHNGMTYSTDFDNGTDRTVIHSVQDVEPIIDHMAAKRRKNADMGDPGIKRGFWHYCSIPTHVELALRQKGINIYNKHKTKEVMKEIRTNYPYLMATNKRHV